MVSAKTTDQVPNSLRAWAQALVEVAAGTFGPYSDRVTAVQHAIDGLGRIHAADRAGLKCGDSHEDDALRAAVIDRQLAEERVAREVAWLRARGWSWTQVADALGVSRQAARQRYGAVEPPQTTVPAGLEMADPLL